MGGISNTLPNGSVGGHPHQMLVEDFADLGWEMLQVGGTGMSPPKIEIDFALVHPDLGVALIDIVHAHADPAQSLRERLRLVGFGEAFPGHLPIVHRVLSLEDLWRLSLVLDPIFTSEAPMEISGREWIPLVRDALTLETGAVEPVEESPNPAEPEFVPPEPARREHTGSWTDTTVDPDADPPAPSSPARERTGAMAKVPNVPRQPKSRGLRRALWLVVAVTGASIGLSHHLTLPEEWKQDHPISQPSERRVRRDDETPTRGDGSVALGAIAAGHSRSPPEEDPTGPISDFGLSPPQVKADEAPAVAMQAEALRPDVLDGLAASSESSPRPRNTLAPGTPAAETSPQPQGTWLPPLEEAIVLPLPFAPSQFAPEYDTAAGLIIEAPAPEAAEPVGNPHPDPHPAEPEIAFEASTIGIEFAAPVVASSGAPPVSNPDVTPAPPFTVNPVPAIPPDTIVTALAPQARHTLPHAVIEMLITRADEMFARGDISGARLLYSRAASAGSTAAAQAMGRSFDADVLNRLGVRGIRPDREQALHWYRMAEESRDAEGSHEH